MLGFDHRAPDYASVFALRASRLAEIRRDRSVLSALRLFYRDNPARFITDWGMTYDPRNVDLGLPAMLPFVLFPKQEEWVGWVVDKWKRRRPGITDKSRDMGVSWLAISLSCTLCLHYDGLSINFGSRKEEYVDKIDLPRSLFFKARMFMANLPEEFRGGWTPEHAPHMRINFPETDSHMGGEAGDNIGRGDRASIYFVDEAAYLERPQLVEASLSQTTNCRIDVSSANGMANPFAQKRHSGKIDVFTFHWRDDPRKDEAWYAKQCEILDPVTIAQEIDIDYTASVEGVLIPSAWVQSAVDADMKLGFRPTGARFGALDVADEGKDLNAFCGAHGVVVQVLEEWSGKESDIFRTVQRAFALCDENEYDSFVYDADGLGAGVRGDARVVNEQRRKNNAKALTVEAFRGSGKVFNPRDEDVKGRKNEDFFANLKAQSWWRLRSRFQRTHRAVKEGVLSDPDHMISLRSNLKNLGKLCIELSQPTYSVNTAGKIVVDKTPDGTKSPNLGDVVMSRFAMTRRAPLVIPAEVVAKSMQMNSRLMRGY